MPATTKLVKADMPDAVLELWAQHRLERVASYQQMQAISNTIRGLGIEGGLETFALPEALRNIRPVSADEVRIVTRSNDEPDKDIAMIHNKASGDETPVLPALAATQSYERFPLLVLGLDQGSLGAAGAAHMEGERFGAGGTNTTDACGTSS